MSVLLIGGTDPNGAGLQADWYVLQALGLQGHSVVTAATAQQNTTVLQTGVLPPVQLRAQLDSIDPQGLCAIKIGMLGDAPTVHAVADYLEALGTHCPPVVLDPVLAASAGGKLLTDTGRMALLERLLPLVTLITPNTDELARLSGLALTAMDIHKLQQAAQQLREHGAAAVLVKGGHFQPQTPFSHDFFLDAHSACWLSGPRWLHGERVRGTGCLFATAVASALAQGRVLIDAVVLARTLTSQGIRHSRPFGQGGTRLPVLPSPPASGWPLAREDYPRLSRFPEPLPGPPASFPRCETRQLGVYPVVDSVDWIRRLVPLGIKTIQLRLKTESGMTAERLGAMIREAATYCRTQQVRLFVNDHWQLALQHQAYGVHLGQEDLNRLSVADLQTLAAGGCRLGVSTHSPAEMARALALEPSYLAIGPVFATTSKYMPWIPQGLDGVKHWVRLLGEHYPLVAIGGIDHERARHLFAAGVGSVAMISAITQAADYRASTRAFLTAHVAAAQ